jgi:FAD synthetase
MRKVVLVGGCFDILHYGHIHFLKEAKKLGDYLVVALESDANTKKLKGSSRPIHNQKQRREILESLNFIDQVIELPDVMEDEDYEKLVRTISPDILAVTKGDPMVEKKSAHAKKIGANLIEIEKVKVPSTTQIAKLIGLE